jgi:hypothetical protein
VQGAGTWTSRKGCVCAHHPLPFHGIEHNTISHTKTSTASITRPSAGPPGGAPTAHQRGRAGRYGEGGETWGEWGPARQQPTASPPPPTDPAGAAHSPLHSAMKRMGWRCSGAGPPPAPPTSTLALGRAFGHNSTPQRTVARPLAWVTATWVHRRSGKGRMASTLPPAFNALRTLYSSWAVRRRKPRATLASWLSSENCTSLAFGSDSCRTNTHAAAGTRQHTPHPANHYVVHGGGERREDRGQDRNRPVEGLRGGPSGTQKSTSMFTQRSPPPLPYRTFNGALRGPPRKTGHLHP